MMRNSSRKRSTEKNSAFVLGSTCFAKGKFNNPFKENSYMHREWQRGFDTAYFNNMTNREQEHAC